ncbi:hypothetical protein [uncultured Draconibacterium sp.]|uniref:hypothetical protein n=1 Tax=uncultured Draconibacterium sp. TaxID=1573823 RepID=UPI003217C4B8
MNELEHGYYWISYRGHEPIIWEYDGMWMACGNEHAEFSLEDGYKIVGKVSELVSDEKEKALHKHFVSKCGGIERETSLIDFFSWLKLKGYLKSNVYAKEIIDLYKSINDC